MSITIQQVVNRLNTVIGDTTEDRVSNSERFDAITQATTWFKQETMNDHSISTIDINYLDTVYYYKISETVADFLQSADLRRPIGQNKKSFTPKSSREIVEDIANEADEDSFAIERRDGETYLVINNYNREKYAVQVSKFDSLTDDGGTWQADTTNSDSTNVRIVNVENGRALAFDIDVSQSGNNRATIYNDDIVEEDLTDYQDRASFLLDVYFPEVTNISSVTFYWGSSSSNYYSVTQTTDINGNAFSADNESTLEFPWLGSSVVGTPDLTLINYIRVDINYASGQTDSTSFRIDNLRLVEQEKLKLHYADWKLGVNSSGADITKYGALTDVPFYSGQYDNYMYPIAEYAGYLILKDLRLFNDAATAEREANKLVEQIKGIIPSSTVQERRAFKPTGIRFNRGRQARYRR